MIVEFYQSPNQNLLKWTIRNNKRLSAKFLLINKNNHTNVKIKPLNLLLTSIFNYVFAKFLTSYGFCLHFSVCF